MDCDNCFRVATKCLPKIKYFSPLDQVSYTLRNWYQKKRMMIQDRVKRLQNLSVKEKYHPYYKAQIEKGGSKHDRAHTSPMGQRPTLPHRSPARRHPETL